MMRRFWCVQAPLGFPDPLLPNDDPAPPTPGAPSPGPPKKIVCEFCQCSLAPNGDYVSLSPRAKTLRALEEQNEALQTQINDLTDERDQSRRDLDDARAALAAATSPTKKPFWSREVDA